MIEKIDTGFPSALQFVLGQHRREQGQLFLTASITTLIALVPIYGARVIIDEAIPETDWTLLFGCVAFMGFAVAIHALLEYWEVMQAKRLQLLFVADLRERLVHDVMCFDEEDLTTMQVGSIQNRIMHDVSRFGMGVEWVFIQPFIAIVELLIYGAFLASMSVQMLVFSLLPLPLIVLFVFRLNRSLELARQRIGKVQGSYSAKLLETLTAISEIRTHGADKKERQNLKSRHGDLEEVFMEETDLLTRTRVAGSLQGKVAFLIVYAFGGAMIFKSNWSLGELVAFTAAIAPFYLSLDTLVNAWPVFRNVKGRYEELGGIMQRARTRAEALNQGRDAQMARIELRSVSLKTASGDNLISNVNLAIPEGDKLAVIGPSGCGKSTLLSVLSQKVQPTGGRVEYLNFSNAATINIPGFIGNIAQKPVTFSGSILDNLRYKTDALGMDVAESELLALSKQVNLFRDLIDFGLQTPDSAAWQPLAKEFLASLGLQPAESEWRADASFYDNIGVDFLRSEDGSPVRETLVNFVESHTCAGEIARTGLLASVGESGARLSGGQRQKVSIVRVLAAKPSIIVADEITSSLDDRSTSNVVTYLCGLSEQTLIFVTHDLTVLSGFRRVLVMEKGSVNRLVEAPFDTNEFASVFSESATSKAS